MNLIKPTKKIEATVRLHLRAQSATPAPPVGPALGQHGLNLAAFCKDFNAKTANVEKGAPVPILIHIHKDRTYTLELKTVTTSYQLRKLAVKKQGKLFISQANVEQVAIAKMKDMKLKDLQAAMKSVLGTARSMQISLEE